MTSIKDGSIYWLIGAGFIYFMLVIEIIYGARNAKKVDRLIVDFIDWKQGSGSLGYSNAQSYEDIP